MSETLEYLATFGVGAVWGATFVLLILDQHYVTIRKKHFDKIMANFKAEAKTSARNE